MHDVDEAPLLWLQEFASRLCMLVLLQLLAGLVTLLAIRSSLPHSQKLVTSLSAIGFLTFLSSRLFDPKTHLIGCMVGGVSMAFTTPLHAVAWVEKAASSKERVSAKTVILRVAIPTALPSRRYPAEHPLHQALRGVVYLMMANLVLPYFHAAVEAGGLIRDATALFFMVSGASGALNLMAAVLGLAGIRSPSPFRKPLLATTLASFWAGRWNAPVSDALRIGLYKPILRRGFPAWVATMASFACSAVAHEVVLVYCGFMNSRGEWFTFFLLAGVLTVIEKASEPFLPRRGRWFVSFVMLYVPFHYLFVPVTIRTGLADAGVRALGSGSVLVRHFWKTASAGSQR